MVWLPPCFPPQVPRHESPSPPPHPPALSTCQSPCVFLLPSAAGSGPPLSLSLAQCPPPTHIPHPSVGSSFLLLHPCLLLAAPRQFTEFSPLTRSQSVLALVFRFGVCVCCFYSLSGWLGVGFQLAASGTGNRRSAVNEVFIASRDASCRGRFCLAA